MGALRGRLDMWRCDAWLLLARASSATAIGLAKWGPTSLGWQVHRLTMYALDRAKSYIPDL